MRSLTKILAAALITLASFGLALAEVSAPEGLKDIPLVETAKIVAAVSQDGTQMVTVEAGVSEKKVKEFYKTALPKAGWKIEMEMENEGMILLSLAKDEWRLMITANKTGENTASYSIARTKE